MEAFPSSKSQNWIHLIIIIYVKRATRKWRFVQKISSCIIASEWLPFIAIQQIIHSARIWSRVFHSQCFSQVEIQIPPHSSSTISRVTFLHHCSKLPKINTPILSNSNKFINALVIHIAKVVDESEMLKSWTKQIKSKLYGSGIFLQWWRKGRAYGIFRGVIALLVLFTMPKLISKLWEANTKVSIMLLNSWCALFTLKNYVSNLITSYKL